MMTKIAKSSITALALIMLATSAGVASAASSTGAAGATSGDRGGTGGGKGSSGNGGGGRSDSSPGANESESDNNWALQVLRRPEREPKRKPERKPKRKLVRLFSDNCLWVKKQRPNSSTYAFRYVIECKQKAQQ